jgi:hypothetical protein
MADVPMLSARQHRTTLFGTLAALGLLMAPTLAHGTSRAARWPLSVERAAASTRHAPIVDLLAIAPATLKAAGGNVALLSVVSGQASSCRIEMMGTGAPDVQACDVGASRAVGYVPPNAALAPRRIRFVLVAHGPGGTRAKAMQLEQAGRASNKPVVSLQPHDVTAATGAVVTLTAAASGSVTPRVQWQFALPGGRWRVLTGATSATLQFAANPGESDDRFRAVFRSAAGLAVSRPALLVVTGTSTSSPTTASTSVPVPIVTEQLAAPAVITQPASVQLASGTTAVFSATASGAPVPSTQWQVSTHASSGWADVAGGGSARLAVPVSSAVDGFRFRAVFANAEGTAVSLPATLDVALAPTNSANWAGYVATDGPYRAITASWTVPTMSCTGASSSYSAIWIGIDGVGSSTVEQDGIDANCQAGLPRYNAWYEMFGDNAVNGGSEVQLPTSDYLVAAGDTIIAGVSRVGTTWNFLLTDTTQGWTFSDAVLAPQPTPKQASAEWIVERPQVCTSSCALSPLSNFGTMVFHGATATTNAGDETLAGLSPTAFALASPAGTTLATPSAIAAGGKSFSVDWQAAS